MSRALYERDVVRRVLALREDLVRHDDNAAALALMTSAVPWFVAEHPDIVAARERQQQMCMHLLDPNAYAAYYATNTHERPFEAQYPGATVDNAHEVFHRVAFLRDGLARRLAPFPPGLTAVSPGAQRIKENPPRVLDVSCNDGWMAANLALAGYRCDGIDLNPDCIDRARARKGRADLGPMGDFVVGDFIRSLRGFLSPLVYDAVACFETIEHVADPDDAMRALVGICKPGGRVYVSTPNGVDHGGDLPGWDHVEPKGHVRVYVPETFHALLSRHGTVERIEQGPDGVMVAEVSL
jgi:2-polyprenyl-3-methyl-5-hydroxy-6-metoxy-1,4-benzoquinol methylase